MTLLDFLLTRFSREFLQLKRKVKHMSEDVEALQNEMNELQAKVNENGETLTGLVDRIIALESNPDADAIKALVQQAKDIKDKLTADEDAADDHLPAA